ncbi:hypothetical protein Bca101_071704 [Brassica carinata]
MYVQEVARVAHMICEILGNQVKVNSKYFENIFALQNSFLRLNKYHPCVFGSQVFGLVPHTDTSFITILAQDQIGGLELKKNEQWIGVKPCSEALTVNIGDMFQALSNGVYQSVRHRVITPANVERLSIAFFVCPYQETEIECSGNPKKYRRFSFREYKEQSERDIKETGDKLFCRRRLGDFVEDHCFLYIRLVNRQGNSGTKAKDNLADAVCYMSCRGNKGIPQIEETNLLRKLSDSCLVLMLLEPSVREELIHNFCSRELISYDQIYVGTGMLSLTSSKAYASKLFLKLPKGDTRILAAATGVDGHIKSGDLEEVSTSIEKHYADRINMSEARHECDRLDVWAQPISPVESTYSRLKLSSWKWTEHVKTAFLVDPRVAVSLAPRFPANIVVKSEVRQLVQVALGKDDRIAWFWTLGPPE